MNTLATMDNNNNAASAVATANASDHPRRVVAATATTATDATSGLFFGNVKQQLKSRHDHRHRRGGRQHRVGYSSYNQLRYDSCFVNARLATEMSHVQRRPFLRDGIVPVNGTRVELCMGFDTTTTTGAAYGAFAATSGSNIEFDLAATTKSFRLSGMITQILPPPAEFRPLSDPFSEEGSLTLSLALANHPQLRGWYPETAAAASATSPQSSSQPPPSSYSCASYHHWNPCGCGHPHCQDKRAIVSAEDWNENVPDRIKRLARSVAVAELGVPHGQQVRCEGRLNFDYDFRRSAEDGPWSDNIPIDGRDVYEFILVANDHKRNCWVLKPVRPRVCL